MSDAAADDPVHGESTSLPLEAEDLLMWLSAERGRAPNTLAAYRRDLRTYVAWLGERGRTLGDVTEAFFPTTSLTAGTLTEAERVIDEPGLDLTIRRNLVDRTDELRRRLAIRAAFGTS
mgnify:CR=1 FL=1